MFFFQSQICRVVKLLNQNMTRFEHFISSSDALEKMNSKSVSFKVLISDIWVLSCFWSSDWSKIFSFNVNNNLFWGGKLNDNVCCSFSRQMYNWKLPDVNSSLNGCNTFKWKSDVLCFLKMKKWRVQYDFENVFFSISNLTRCKPLKSKSDAYWNFQFKNMLFKKSTKNAKYVVFTE